MFEFDYKNYAETNSQAGHKTMAILPRIDYTNKTNKEIHFTINNGLQQGQLMAKKIAKKKKPTKEDNTMIEALRNATQAYIELADKTLLEEDHKQKFEKLADIASHLKQKTDGQQRQESDEDD